MLSTLTYSVEKNNSPSVCLLSFNDAMIRLNRHQRVLPASPHSPSLVEAILCWVVGPLDSEHSVLHDGVRGSCSIRL